MLSGKHYNNAVHTLKYVYEALFLLELEAFDDWLLVNNKVETLETITNKAAIQACSADVITVFSFAYSVYDFIDKEQLLIEECTTLAS